MTHHISLCWILYFHLFLLLLFSFADPRGRQARLPGAQILSFSCNFRQKIGKIIALLGVGAPPWGKSRIRHWFFLNYELPSKHLNTNIKAHALGWFKFKLFVLTFYMDNLTQNNMSNSTRLSTFTWNSLWWKRTPRDFHLRLWHRSL